ncbi:N-acetylglucosamine 6-phosphate deacetylase [Roseibium hamelinense]|uniref:N-acetylglucosamine 6-phosphate deacetylase n=1 Tax=Roseibium hamelinense TaxID=150831 RepID=A0A562SXM8_9HYPH|nr:N-acetylglucosamine-6-phosphate deacetylase [Roseibium hamelinense]MTI44787.1 N-acetylglucosamine-6-phosphate deacetylase [Roseibium hamelinense]TWI86021.1 N-acetylglucosamine 6-phosphate deacetylase [Roseibium hamelinense]
MSARLKAFVGASIFDGERIHKDCALLTHGGTVECLVRAETIPPTYERVELNGGILAPGFVDLQVNGGGGVMFNDAPTLGTLKTIAEAHRTLGATSILPTLITDDTAHVHAAIRAAEQAIEARVPGITGLHLEGPHLSLARKGAHSADLIRQMSAEDLLILLEAADRLPVLKITVAPESVSCEQIRALCQKGVIVSLGHTDAGYDICRTAAEAGARCVTHLFNAQSQLGNREPGVVGAALDLGNLSAGLIADTIHVHSASMRLALRAKQGPGQIFLVSDAMATAGSDIDHFLLNHRKIIRSGHRLTLEDGTLAGAHLDLATAIRNLVQLCAVPVEQALAMATSWPAKLIGLSGQIGRFSEGARADIVHLSSDLRLQTVY